MEVDLSFQLRFAAMTVSTKSRCVAETNFVVLAFMAGCVHCPQFSSLHHGPVWCHILPARWRRSNNAKWPRSHGWGCYHLQQPWLPRTTRYQPCWNLHDRCKWQTIHPLTWQQSTECGERQRCLYDNHNILKWFHFWVSDQESTEIQSQETKTQTRRYGHPESRVQWTFTDSFQKWQHEESPDSDAQYSCVK